MFKVDFRQDALLPLVEEFFAPADLRPRGAAKLARQLRAREIQARRTGARQHAQMRDAIADVDRPIGMQIQALDQGIEPNLVGTRIQALRTEKEQIEDQLRDAAPEPDNDGRDVAAALDRIPDLTQTLRDAPDELKRQVFDASELRILYGKAARRIEISATISQAIAETLENANDLPEEVANVAQRDIAGAGFEPATFGL